MDTYFMVSKNAARLGRAKEGETTENLITNMIMCLGKYNEYCMLMTDHEVYRFSLKQTRLTNVHLVV